MKILWMSDSPMSPSGFGNVTRHVCGGLARLGHSIDIIGWQASGEAAAWEGCTVHPVRRAQLGAEVLLGYLQKLRPDVLVTLADVWWLTFIEDPFIASFRQIADIPWALYFPIDGDLGDGRLPPSWVRILQAVDLPIAMSEYGAGVAEVNGVSVAMIPHGVETSVFRPPADKAAAKRRLGYEDCFVVLSDARNQPRKMLPRTLDVFRRFARGKRDVLLHLHCDPRDPAATTRDYHYDVRADIELLGLSDIVRFSADMEIRDGGIPLEELARIYQAADVHLLASLGEGFGLPTLQAAATGVVPLAADGTASRELVAGHGELLPASHLVSDRFGIQRLLIDVEASAQRIEQLYRDPARRSHMAEAGVRFAQPYAWDAVVQQWDDLLRTRVPALRGRIRHQAGSGANVSILGAAASSAPDRLTQSVRASLPSVLDAVELKVGVVARQAGELAFAVGRDASGSIGLTIPVTLESADPKLAPARVTGSVYLASERDVAVARALSAVFPGLNAWSTTPFSLGPRATDGEPVPVKVVAAHTSDYVAHLAATTLALDLEGHDAALPSRAAALAVPCIGVAAMGTQAELWPTLTLAVDDTNAAVESARTMLVDKGLAATACANARALLVAKEAGV